MVEECPRCSELYGEILKDGTQWVGLAKQLRQLLDTYYSGYTVDDVAKATMALSFNYLGRETSIHNIGQKLDKQVDFFKALGEFYVHFFAHRYGEENVILSLEKVLKER